ncbi:hypothetical protein HS7_05780 [Sulfolobales archaeon HS-7]|nr:hypothetical protein HS7_05780 [Sulfolobales archaeon HS-7]
MKIIHNISKSARSQIISLMLRERTEKELAEALDISPASITKYIKEVTHPSDKIIEKCLEIANDYEAEQIVSIILSDVFEALVEFLKVAGDKIPNEEVNILVSKIRNAKRDSRLLLNQVS